jgi:polyisoprenoid-binding protein YceI
MGVPDGTYSVGPHAGRLLVRTARSGLGARAGHDLTLEVTRWRGSAALDSASPASSAVAVEAEVASIEVREGTGGVKPLTDSDRAEIRKTMTGKILQAGRYPTINFQSTLVGGSPEAFWIEGDLTIMGTTQPVTVHGSLAGGRARGSATITQSDWGIKPYSAFFGALRLRDEVEVEFDVALEPGG